MIASWLRFLASQIVVLDFVASVHMPKDIRNLMSNKMMNFENHSFLFKLYWDHLHVQNRRMFSWKSIEDSDGLEGLRQGVEKYLPWYLATYNEPYT